jgi:DHA1 family inner membrane transport protein
MTGLFLIGGLNILAGVSTSFSFLIGVRIACGIAAGLVGPISSVAATELVPKERRGKAIGIAMSGMTGAFVLGIPMGSALGEWFGWRGTFFYAGGIALLAAAIDRLLLPPLPGSKPVKSRAFKMIVSGQVLSTYALTLVGFASTFTTIAYIGPFVTAATGLTGSGVGMMQSLIGVGSILGIALGIRIADSRLALKVIAITFGVTAISMVSQSLIMILLPMDETISALTPGRLATLTLFGVSMIMGSAALFSRTPVIQTRLVSQSPQEVRPVMMALNGSMVFLGQGLGAAIGGLSISMIGMTWLGLTAGVVASVGMVFTLVLDRQERLSEERITAALAIKC